LFLAEHEKSAADDHRSDADVRLPVNAVFLFLRYLDYSQVNNLLFGDIGKTSVDRHEQAYDEDDDAGCFHNYDLSLMGCADRMSITSFSSKMTRCYMPA